MTIFATDPTERCSCFTFTYLLGDCLLVFGTVTIVAASLSKERLLYFACYHSKSLHLRGISVSWLLNTIRMPSNLQHIPILVTSCKYRFT